MIGYYVPLIALAPLAQFGRSFALNTDISDKTIHSIEKIVRT